MNGPKHFRPLAFRAGTGTCKTAEHPANRRKEKTPSRGHKPATGATGYRPLLSAPTTGYPPESAAVPSGTPYKPEQPYDRPNTHAFPSRQSGQDRQKPRTTRQTGTRLWNGAAPADRQPFQPLPSCRKGRSPSPCLPAFSWSHPMETPIEQKIFPTVHAVLKTAGGENDSKTAAFIGAVAMELFAILLAGTGNRPDIIDSFIEAAGQRAAELRKKCHQA